jgi:hypothetical protein
VFLRDVEAHIALNGDVERFRDEVNGLVGGQFGIYPQRLVNERIGRRKLDSHYERHCEVVRVCQKGLAMNEEEEGAAALR